MEVSAQETTAGIQLNVAEIGEKRASFAIGDFHRWIIRCNLPETEDVREYTIIQTLPPALTYHSGSVVVQFYPDAGETILLQMERDYILTSGSVFVEKGTADRISLSLTREGSQRIQSGGELRILYEAILNENAPIGTQILSSAQLNCTSGSGNREVYLSDRAAVYTGGLNILLTDMDHRPLSGGKFMLARPANQEEIEDTTVLKEHLDVDGTQICVVYETFCTGLEDRQSSVAETNERGEAMCMGLPFGIYYLVRVDIPELPVKVTVDEASHLTRLDRWTDSQGSEIDNTVRIESTGILIPRTGGTGTLVYRVLGLLVILCACILLWNNRKRPVYMK